MAADVWKGRVIR